MDRETGSATFFKDLIRNQVISIENKEIDDFVIVREDGIPTYNFAVVIDDALSGITHVLRGDDHVSNTPKQIMLYNALGFKVPEFAHVSMILGPDGKRLSKRHGATSVIQYKKEGFLPEALVNYLIRLGWSHGNDEILSMDEIIKFFDLKNISKSAAIFNAEKLLWLNSHYIKSKDPFALISLINDISEDSQARLNEDVKTAALVDSLKSRSKTLVELRQKLDFFLNKTVEYNAGVINEFNFNQNDAAFLQVFKDFIISLDDDIFIDGKNLEGLKVSIESIKNAFNDFLSQNGWTMKEKAMIIRLAFTGEKVSPPIYEMIFSLGKERCTERIEAFLGFLSGIKN